VSAIDLTAFYLFLPELKSSSDAPGSVDVE